MLVRLLLSFLFVVVSSASHAQSSDTWTTGVTDSGEMLYAATINDSGNLLGEYCSPSTGNCIWLLGMSTACKEGDQYPILANSDAGAAHIMVYCSAKLDNGLYRYVFTEFDSINNIVTKGLRVGFAVPLQADQFRVVRFDLSGSNRALALMLEAAQKAQKKPTSKPTGTRDQDL
jgi:hypothetical protein